MRQTMREWMADGKSVLTVIGGSRALLSSDSRQEPEEPKGI